MISYTTLPIIALIISMIHPTPVRMAIIRTAESRSSIISSTDGYVLLGNVIHYQRTPDVLACAQQCLAHPNCVSFNFENIRNGLCELNKETSDAGRFMDKNILFPKGGHSFYQLLNISVCRSFVLSL